LSPEPLAKEVRDFLERPPDGWRIWEAEEGGRVVAFAEAGPRPDGGSGSVAELYTVANRVLIAVHERTRSKRGSTPPG
jgi:hypothetical protein